MISTFFKKINILLSVFILIYFAYLFLALNNISFAESTTPSPNPTSTQITNTNTNSINTNGSEPIFRDLQVRMEADDFDVDFQSDGMNDKAGSERKEAFLQSGLEPLAIPMSFSFISGESYANLLGELQFDAIPRITAPSDTICDPNDPNYDSSGNCLEKATAFSLFFAGASTDVTASNEAEATYIFSLNVSSLVDTVEYILSTVVNILPIDRTRDACGLNSFWAEDELQGQADVNDKPVEVVTVCVDESAVIRTADYMATMFTQLYNGGDVVKPNAFDYAKDKGIGIFPRALGAEVTNVNTVEELADYIQKFFQNLFGLFTQNEKMAPQVALRSTRKADTFKVGYEFCKAVDDTAAGVNGYDPYVPDPGVLNDGNGPPLNCELKDTKEKRDSCYEESELARYRRVVEYDRRCLQAVYAYHSADGANRDMGKQRADNCAKSMAAGNGCEFFSIEEVGLKFMMRNETLPIGLNTVFLNTAIADLDPTLNGPHINFLSPQHCSGLSMVYDIDRGKDYMYYYGHGDGEEVLTKVENKYCIVGAKLSNFSNILSYSEAFFSSETTDEIRQYRNGLTCDKKERVIFGGNPVWASASAPQDQLIYVLDDNERGGGVAYDSENLVLMHGYNPFSVSDIIKEVGEQSVLAFGNSRDGIDMRVAVDMSSPGGGIPKFVTFVTEHKDASGKADEDANRKYLCLLQGPGNLTQPVKSCYDLGKPAESIFTPYPIYAGGLVILIDQSESKGERGKKLEYKIIRPDLNDMSKSQVLGTFPIFEAPYFSVTVLDNGNFAVMGFDSDNFNKTKVAVINPFNSLGSESGQRQAEPQIFNYDGFCSGDNAGVCSAMALNPAIPVMDYDPANRKLHLLMMGNGLGLITAMSPYTNAVNEGNVFTFNTKVENGFEDLMPIKDNKISAFHADSLNSSYRIFLNDSGDYLEVFEPSKGGAAFEAEVLKNCNVKNCMATMQMQFNPMLWDTDFSDYYGKGACANKEVTAVQKFTSDNSNSSVCNFEPLSRLSPPIVVDFTVMPNGQMYAWYRHQGLDKTILYSEDMLYAYSGKYTQINGNEYSNVYVPLIGGGGSAEEGKQEDFGVGVKAVPVRYLVPLNLGETLIEISSIITENPDIDTTKNIEKRICKEKLYNDVSDTSGYEQATGLIGQSLNFQKFPKGKEGEDGEIPALSGYSSNNPGEYCEETWCTPNEYPIWGNPKFKLQQYGGEMTEAELEEITQVITDFVVERKKSSVTTCSGDDDSYPCLVKRMCRRAAQEGIPCQVLLAIWGQESSLSPNSNAIVRGRTNPLFGCNRNNCFGCTAGAGCSCAYFDEQLDCAADTIGSWGKRYSDGVPLGEGKGPLSASKGNNCTPYTQFSEIMEAYTPLDLRRNFDNQCNAGLVVRPDQDNYCGAKNVKGYPSAPAGFRAGYTDTFPSNIQKYKQGTRPNLRFFIEKINARLSNNNLKIPTQEACYPGKSSTDFNKLPEAEGTIAYFEKDYEFATRVSTLKLDFVKSWGNDAARGYIQFMLENGFGPRTYKANQDPSEGPRPLLGAHIVEPGDLWRMNGTVGIPAANDYIRLESDSRYSQFDFSDRTKYGGGLCELGTAFKQAFVNLRDQSGNKLFGDLYPKSGVKQLYTDANISFWTHTNDGITITPGLFNKHLVGGYENYGISNRNEFVSIWYSGGNNLTQNGGNQDFEIHNTDSRFADQTLLIYVSQDPNTGIITIEMAFGRPLVKPGNSYNPVQKSKTAAVIIYSDFRYRFA